VCAIDFVPRLSWVACFSHLPVLLFNADGRVFAADVLSGALVAQLDQPVLAASGLIPRTKDLGQLLEHTLAVAAAAPVAFGDTGMALIADATNDSGERRKRVFQLDAAQLISVAYPVIDQVFHRATVDQLAYVLGRLPDASDRSKLEVVVAQQPPGTIHHDHQARHGSMSMSGAAGTRGAARRASSLGGSTRAADTPASTVRPIRPAPALAGSRALAGSCAGTGTGDSSSKKDGSAPLPAIRVVHGPQSPAQRVQAVIDSRVASKAQREQRFKSLWQSMQPS
jgi:hypothetical protein